MMTRLMTWFIESVSQFNESRLFKTSMIYVLNCVNDLTSWQESRLNSNFIDLKLQKFMHMIEMIETKLLKLN